MSGLARLPLRVGRVLLRALLHALPTALVVLALNFALIKLAPGDAADMLLDPGSDDAAYQAMRDSLGIGDGTTAEVLGYARNLAHLELGRSYFYSVPVTTLIAERLANTVLLMLSAFALALLAGVALGAVMARRPGGWTDRLLSLVVVLIYSTPTFLAGLVLMVVFSAHLGWLPSAGASGVLSDDLGFWPALADRLRHLILPAVSIAAFYIAIYARLVRSAMIEIEAQPFVRTARAKGAGEFRVQVHHILRNALLPISSVASLHVGGMLSGTVIVETVFGWPGLGRLIVDAITHRDVPVLLGVLLMSAMFVVVMNLLADILQTLIDPRILAGR